MPDAKQEEGPLTVVTHTIDSETKKPLTTVDAGPKGWTQLPGHVPAKYAVKGLGCLDPDKGKKQKQ